MQKLDDTSDLSTTRARDVLSRSIIAIIFFSTSMIFRFRSLNSRDCDAPFAAVANDSTFKHTLWLLDRHSLQQTRHSFMDKLGKLSNLRKDSEDLRVFISKAKELREVFGFVEQSSVDIHAFLLKHLKKSEIAELESKIESKERNVKVSKLSSLKRLSLKRGQSHDLRLSFDETACNTTTDNMTSFPKVDKALTFPSVEIACIDQRVNRFRMSLEANPKQTFKFLLLSFSSYVPCNPIHVPYSRNQQIYFYLLLQYHPVHFVLS
jgi:hypothetical protein